MNSPNRIGRILLLTTLVLVVSVLQAQPTDPKPVHFKFSLPAKSMQVTAIDPARNGRLAAHGKPVIFLFLRFNEIQDSRKMTQLRGNGIELLEYIPQNTYLARVSGSLGATQLKMLGVIATIPMERNYKMDPATGTVYTLQAKGKNALQRYHLKLAEQDNVAAAAELQRALQGIQAPWALQRFAAPGIAEVDLSAPVLEKLLDEPFVLYAMELPELQALNEESRQLHNTEMLYMGSAGMPGLSGEGVTMGIGDAGTIYHIDHGYNGEGQLYNSDFHATHVAGTMAGAGIRNPANKGHAYRSSLLVEQFNNIIYKTPEYYSTNRMVLTNNSYGTSSACLPYSGVYTSMCYQADYQLLQFPNLVHVFAAGNSGNLVCGDFPAGYRAINNAYQSGKNVLTVGGTTKDATQNRFSKGPVQDGRIKPEIAAIGSGVISTVSGNNYGSNNGTSMAAPQVTGAMALVVERYRQLNGGQDPPGDLMKAIICNTATDIGAEGVDFANGFGWLNTARAVDLVNRRNWFAGTAVHNEEQRFEITVDKIVHDFRIMLYWHDQPASFYSFKNLVNDLDLTVQLPDGSIYDPMILDTSLSGILNPAIMGKDHINNIEQVVIKHALPGRYIVRVKGFEVPIGPQSFKLVYHWQEPGLQLLQPAGGERWKPAQVKGISWQDAGRETDNYSFSFSADDGNSWTSISPSTPLYSRSEWTVPNIYTTTARIQMRNEVTGEEMTSGPFTILPEIAFTLSTNCSENMTVRWPRPPGIDSFAVLRYIDGQYREVALTTDTVVQVTGLLRGPDYWFTVQPVKNGITGERSVARVSKTSTAVCPAGGLPGDLAITAWRSPGTIREHTSNGYDGQAPVSIMLRNRSTTAFNDSIFLAVYKNGVLAGRDTLKRNFPNNNQFEWKTRIMIDVQPGETADLMAVVTKVNDPVDSNNTLVTRFRYLANPALSLPYTENFTAIADTAYGRTGYIGVNGAEAWDISTLVSPVQLLTKTGQPAGFFQATNVRGQKAEFIGTFNLSAYADSTDLHMVLRSAKASLLTISVRGSDTSQWITLPLYQAGKPILLLHNIMLGEYLKQAGQKPGASFQVRVAYSNNAPDADSSILSGIFFFRMASNVGHYLTIVDKPTITDMDTLLARVYAYNNLSTTVKDIAIGISLPDGRTFSGTLDSLEGRSVSGLEFTVPIDRLPAMQNELRPWVSAPGDHFPDDDSGSVSIVYSPKISAFPYVEGFEEGRAGWESSLLLELSPNLDTAYNPFRAANGTSFWGMRRAIPNGSSVYVTNVHSLLSPVFQTAQLRRPYLSMSLNRQLCMGQDSVYLLISPDTGRTWLQYRPTGNTTNWYDSTGNGYPWMGCGQPGWQVVSAPLPEGWNSVQFMLRTVPAGNYVYLARPVEGMWVDDIHVFDLEHTVYGDRSDQQAGGQAIVNQWTPITAGNQVMAAVKAGSAQIPYRFRLAANDAAGLYKGNPVLRKSWVFNDPGAAAASNEVPDRVRLYFTHAEAAELLAAHPCDTCRFARTPYDLSVFRYNGPAPGVNGYEQDNLPGRDETWSPESFDLVPYESGYYAELPVSPYGEFYIGINKAIAGLDFRASKQPDAMAVFADWDLPRLQGISGFTLERAAVAANAAPQAMVFEVIATINPVTGKTSYRYRDQYVQFGFSYHYRLKITHTDGSITYSGIRTISFEPVIRAVVYPNPSATGEFTLLLENLQGKKTDLRLFDPSGRYIWGRSLAPATTRLQLVIPEGGGRLAAGVYLLQVEAEGQKKTIRLVVSGN